MTEPPTPFRKRLLIPVLATVGVTVALVVAAPGTPSVAPGQAAAAQSRPNVVVIESDDQTLESLRVMHNVNSLIGAKGATFKNSFVNYSLCCPSRSTFLTGQYEHNHGVLSNRGRTAASPASRPCTATTTSPSGSKRWLLHRHDRQVPERLREPAAGAAGLVGVARGRSEAAGVYEYTINNNGTLVLHGDAPADFKQDVLTEGGRVRQPPGAEAGPVLPLAHLHGPARRPARSRTRTRPATAAAPPSRRPDTLTHSTQSRCRSPRTSTRRTSPTSRLAIRELPPLERKSDRRHPASLPLRAGIAAVGGRGGQEGRPGADGKGSSTTR